MAKANSTTSIGFADTVTNGAPGRIGVLAALRGGVAAMSNTLSGICDTSHDEKAELAFIRSLDELNDIDREILSAPATGLADLSAQASIVRSRIADDTLGDQHVSMLLDSIQRLVQ